MRVNRRSRTKTRACFRYDTYCGIYCAACDTLIANEKGTVAKLARAWKRRPEELVCHGCKTESIAVFCIRCKMRQCVLKKNVEFCFECKDFPCSMLLAFRYDHAPHHSTVLKNLKAIEQRGLKTWLKDQKARWSCPRCGTKFSWYNRTCKECGGELFDCVKEEKELDKIRTERLVISPVMKKDLKLLLRIWNDPEIMEYAGFARDWEYRQAEEWHERYQRRLKEHGNTETQFVIRLKNGRSIGESGLGRLEPSWSCTGYRAPKNLLALMTDIKLLKRHWNKGYATEAMKALAGYVFAETAADLLLVPPHRDNPAAIRVYEEAGFKRTNGVCFRHHMVYEMTAEEFRRIGRRRKKCRGSNAG
ncbi:GNAT family N-acetyltransferase [candidate division WOR-3 bacterium]|nr:GNAT family N-acetyltransferase [candidate division WOR-3 bacterium]